MNPACDNLNHLYLIYQYLLLYLFVTIHRLYCSVDRDMGARHRARANSIQIMRVERIPSSKCRRANIKQFHVRSLTVKHQAVPRT